MKPLPKIIHVYQQLTLSFNYYEVYGSTLIFKIMWFVKMVHTTKEEKGRLLDKCEDVEGLIQMIRKWWSATRYYHAE